MRYRSSAGAFVLLAAAVQTPVYAANAADDQAKAFELGQINVTAKRPGDIEIGGEILTSEAIFDFNRSSIDDAVNLMPGVAASNSGGSRNGCRRGRSRADGGDP